jgi:hypothetical protein
MSGPRLGSNGFPHASAAAFPQKALQLDKRGSQWRDPFLGYVILARISVASCSIACRAFRAKVERLNRAPDAPLAGSPSADGRRLRGLFERDDDVGRNAASFIDLHAKFLLGPLAEFREWMDCWRWSGGPGPVSRPVRRPAVLRAACAKGPNSLRSLPAFAVLRSISDCTRSNRTAPSHPSCPRRGGRREGPALSAPFQIPVSRVITRTKRTPLPGASLSTGGRTVNTWHPSLTSHRHLVTLPPRPNPLRRAADSYLTRFKGESRVHTGSDMRCYLTVARRRPCRCGRTDALCRGDVGVFEDRSWCACFIRLRHSNDLDHRGRSIALNRKTYRRGRMPPECPRACERTTSSAPAILAHRAWVTNPLITGVARSG